MTVLWNLAYMLVLLAIGVGLRTLGFLDDTRSGYLTSVAFYGALPALVFTATYSQPLEAVFSPEILFGVLGVYGGVFLLGWLVHWVERTPATRSVAIMQSYHTNLGFLGLPIVAATFGTLATAKASLILGVALIAQVAMSVTTLTTLNGSERSLWREIVALLANPILAALLLGLAFSMAGLGVPESVASLLGMLGEFALPIALLAIGASLTPEFEAFDAWTVSRITFLKCFAMPLLALVLFAALRVPQTTLQAVVVMLAMPAAVSTFVYASELGGDRELASVTVFVTTIVSLLAVFVFIPFLR